MSGASISTGVEATTSHSGINDSARGHRDQSGSKSDSSHNSSTDRKVISHLFGRNKVCTRQIPEHLFEKLPRKRYQRLRYIESEWAFRQLHLLRAQVMEMQKWGGVRSWAIELKAATKREIEQEDKGLASGSRCADRFFLPHIGSGKEFWHVYRAINAIEEDLRGRAEAKRSFPGVEFLPEIDIEQHPPRPLNGKAPSSLSLKIRNAERRPSKPVKDKSKSSLSLETRDRKRHLSSRLKGKSKLLSPLESLETLKTRDLVKLWLKEKEEYENTVAGQ